jgi:hypothetical protein
MCYRMRPREAAMVSIDHFRQGLLAQMNRAAAGGRIDVLINSADLYRSLGGYPGSTHGMPSCCDAMEAEMKLGDSMVLDRTSGAGMTVRYLLPRAN